ncbi:MAG: sigma-70 family RNA polymerase sigma factor [Acidobacteriota bacterium]|nr:sigma-70 family RNA polymerase sigma factor [Acidobacteriota bacterium]
MRHTTFANRVLPASYISESSPLEEPPFKPESTGWTDDEIASIRAVLEKMTAIRIFNATDAEDLVQETLLTMVSKPPEAVLEKGPLVWSLGILRRKVGNYYRKTQRYTPLNEQDAEIQQLLRSVSPEAKLLLEEMERIVEGVLSRLPQSQRRALDLMLAGFTSGEIARLLQPERYQNVINSLYRGRKKIVRELARHGCIPGAPNGICKMKISRGKFGGAKREQGKVRRQS